VRRRGLTVARSTEPVWPAAIDVLLVDTLGQLAALYAGTEAAFVGGSLVPVGGHNLLEPAALGVPVLAGPHLANVQDTADELGGCGGLAIVRDAAELAHEVACLVGSPAERARRGAAAEAVVRAHRGALARATALVLATVGAAP
jgi:3-deoxy-D-manno-octulosonic-acid transferase